MAKIKPVIQIEIDPTHPVPEICQVIMAVMPFHPGQDEAILRGVKEAVEKRLEQLRGGTQNDGKQVR